jgi:chromate transporter
MGEIARLFLRLGATAFGGPAAHIALMRAEVVQRRQWLSEQQFLDLLGATNLIPGPNSTEMAIHIGFLRGGYRGLLLAGACFILPAMLIVTGLAWLYQQTSQLPQLEWLLYGIRPVVLAIILHALWSLGKKALQGPLTAAAGLVVLLLYLLGINEIALLIGAGLFVTVVKNLRGAPPPAGTNSGWMLLPVLTAAAQQVFSLPVLFFTFLKIGSVLYGSGYVLLAFLRADFVQRLGWLTDQQLLDAITIGQVTPGPVFTTATFIGYLLGGVPGAGLATLGIFLPAFVFVALSNPLIPRLRNSPWTAALLDGINAASLGLMAGVTLQLAAPSLVDPLTILLAAAALFCLFRTRLNPTWLILGGAAAGLLAAWVR